MENHLVEGCRRDVSRNRSNKSVESDNLRGYMIVYLSFFPFSLDMKRLEAPRPKGASIPPRRRIPVSNSRKISGGKTTMTSDPCFRVWITISETTTKQRRRPPCACPECPESKDATLKRKRLLCAPSNDVSRLPMCQFIWSFRDVGLQRTDVCNWTCPICHFRKQPRKSRTSLETLLALLHCRSSPGNTKISSASLLRHWSTWCKANSRVTSSPIPSWTAGTETC